MTALLIATGALLVSIAAALYTRSSAQSASNAVALSLSTDVEVRLAKNSELTHNRWLYNEQSPLAAIQGWHLLEQHQEPPSLLLVTMT